MHTIKANEIITCQAIVNEIYAKFMSWTELTKAYACTSTSTSRWIEIAGLVLPWSIVFLPWAVSECWIILRLIVRIIPSQPVKCTHNQITILYEWRKRCIGKWFWFNEWHHFSLEWFHFCHVFLFHSLFSAFFFCLSQCQNQLNQVSIKNCYTKMVTM